MNKLLAFGGIVTLVGGLLLLVVPVTHIPLLDANRQVLAESVRAGECAGEVFAGSRGYGDEPAMLECMELSEADIQVNHRQVQPAFCRGIINGGLQITQDECETIMDNQKYWPTMTGALTSSWNRRFPYPGGVLSASQPTTGGESRTGDRIGNEREGTTR